MRWIVTGRSTWPALKRRPCFSASPVRGRWRGAGLRELRGTLGRIFARLRRIFARLRRIFARLRRIFDSTMELGR